MAYSTGSGTYTDLMAAVLAHAVADGWVEAGGVGTGWPISKGNVRGINWTTTTATEADYTLNGDGLSKTQRYMKLGLGSTPAGATANAASGPACPNFAYTITQWWIFSDTSLNNHIHVVFRFSNGASSDVYSHFSFGEIDKGGLTYGSVAYVTCSDRRGYALDLGGGATSPDLNSGGSWNTLNRAGNSFAGQVGKVDNGTAALDWMVHSTSAPLPNGTGGWPAWDTIIRAGANAWAFCSPRVGSNYYLPNFNPDLALTLCSNAWAFQAQNFSGQISLTPIPFIAINGSAGTSRMRWLGVFPNVRLCSLSNVNAEDEFTFGGDTWKVFPLLRKTVTADLNVSRKVTSGLAGIAFKKVP